MHVIIKTDPHVKTHSPFVFFHIPKTAGSTLRLLVSKFFDVQRTYPGLDFYDYLTSGLAKYDLNQFGLFMGDMSWAAVECIGQIFGRYPRIFSVIRKPVSHAKSQLAFVQKVRAAGLRTYKDFAGTTKALSDFELDEHLRIFILQVILIGNDNAGTVAELLSTDLAAQTARALPR